VALVIGLDGDDTLWHNEKVFSMTQARFSELLAPFVAGQELERHLLDTERRNLGLFGYGVKSFTLSMIETAIEISEGAVPVAVIAELVAQGKQMLDHPVELFDGVAEVVPALAERWRLLLITKGDLFHQESKLARSGLLPHLWRVEIVSEKDPDTYRRVLTAAGVDPGEFVMVGDSLRSDIAPVLALGGRAVHIPGFREWELERAELGPELADRWWRRSSIRALPALLDELDELDGADG